MREISSYTTCPKGSFQGFSCARVATGQEMVREINSSSSGKPVRELYFESGKIDILKKRQGKLK